MVHANRPGRVARARAWGASRRPLPGLAACGDVTVIRAADPQHLFLVADALGHGPDAARSADVIADLVRAAALSSLKDLFGEIDRALRGRRGAVAGALLTDGSRVTFAGTGNIELYGPADAARPATAAGMLGRPPFRFREQVLEITAGQRWVLASDGIRARDMRKTLEATQHLDAEAAAPRIIELAARPDDDASALVVDF